MAAIGRTGTRFCEVAFVSYVFVGLVASPPHCSGSELAICLMKISFAVSSASHLSCLVLSLFLSPDTPAFLGFFFFPRPLVTKILIERAAILDWMLPDRRLLASVAGGGDDEWRRGSSFTRREPSTVKKSKTGEQSCRLRQMLVLYLLPGLSHF